MTLGNVPIAPEKEQEIIAALGKDSHAPRVARHPRRCKLRSGVAGGGQTLDPHTLGVITALASASRRSLLSYHLHPHDYTSKIEFLTDQPFQEPR